MMLLLILCQELLEPLWDDLLQELNNLGISVKGIWIADMANQGASYVLNEKILGSDRRLLKQTCNTSR